MGRPFFEIVRHKENHYAVLPMGPRVVYMKEGLTTITKVTTIKNSSIKTHAKNNRKRMRGVIKRMRKIFGNHH